MIFIFVLTIFNFITKNEGLMISRPPKLLVVSFDGFRYDYFDRNLTPFMNKLKHQSTHVDYMMNMFLTKTFPNHHTIATGFYVETHGVIDIEFIDSATKKKVDDRYELYHYNKNVLPIWTINEKAGVGRRSGTMMWPGCTFEYEGIVPTFSKKFNSRVSLTKRVDTLISWFTHPVSPINLGILYIEEPDNHGHAIGIYDPKFNEILTKLDNLTEYLHKKLESYELEDVNVIYLSDHGMSTVSMNTIINLTKYINESDYVWFGLATARHIYPNHGKEELIYKNLKAAANQTRQFQVYKKEEIPERFRYSDNPRIGPIFIVAELGHVFNDFYHEIDYYKKHWNITVTNTTEFGLHGYSNDVKDMHPFFFAKGPAFISECKVEPFNNTDLFPLFCKILELDCPVVNGTYSSLSKCLKIKVRNNTITGYRLIFVAITLVTTLMGIIAVLKLLLVRK
ncbi:ectonucleotide pyrophosphatase/phosphodiesterase family member 5-like isoform X2 [Prorops nasuta]|uniref:ectonucleotide pyrophosphatase/phosphodiesterase family member 5-like isoform X2 n=1 Tax=Prorops nasuta TaxID=863751 RepID=UPI0034CE85D8